MGYLGFWVTRNGIRPINKKVEAIVNMTPPTRQKQMREFIGLVKYYREMWSKQSHLLHPLTELTSNKVKFKCTDAEKKSFDDIKLAVACDTLLAYPYFNKCYDIHTDARNYQTGAVIIQCGKPISSYSHKLTSTQTRYTLTERELLIIVKNFEVIP